MSKNPLTVVLISVLLLPVLVAFGPIPQPVKAQQSSASFSDDFSSDTGAWEYLGSTYRDTANRTLILTTSSNDQGGVAFFNTPIQGAFTVSFRYKAGSGGYQGDGFTIFFYKQEYSTVGLGGSLGFTPYINEVVPGYGIEFDGWQNIASDFQQFVGAQPLASGDPSSSHIALIQDYVGNHLASVNDPRATDNNWHTACVEVQGSSVTVTIDQAVVLQWSGALNRTFDGFGFSGANGQVGSQWHIIDDFSITAKDLHPPSLTASCVTSVSQSSYHVKINGALTFNGAGIADAPILLSYSVTGGEYWQDLTFIHTGAAGIYSASWFPSASGDYMLKAVYRGDENYLGTSGIINFVIAPCDERNAFSVNSNSTITALSFDSASKELSFNITGYSGTTGYVSIYIPKTLVNDTVDFKVCLDSSQIQYTAQSQGDCCLLYFTYHHSSHIVTISLDSSAIDLGLVENIVLIAVLAVTVVAIAVLIVVFKDKNVKTTQNSIFPPT